MATPEFVKLKIPLYVVSIVLSVILIALSTGFRIADFLEHGPSLEDKNATVALGRTPVHIIGYCFAAFVVCNVPFMVAISIAWPAWSVGVCGFFVMLSGISGVLTAAGFGAGPPVVPLIFSTLCAALGFVASLLGSLPGTTEYRKYDRGE